MSQGIAKASAGGKTTAPAADRGRRVAFDASSLNKFRDDPRGDEILGALHSSGHEPLLSALNVVEMMKWEDVGQRDLLLTRVVELRGVADLRLLPLPHEVVEAEFRAWLHNDREIRLGGERVAVCMLALLVHPESRQPAWSEAARVYAEAEQRSFVSRLAGITPKLRDLPRRSSSLDAFVHELLNSGEELSAILHGWFPDLLDNQALVRPDEAVGCATHLHTFRTLLVTLGVAAWRHAVLGKPVRKKKDAGAFDIQQAVYLPLVDLFIVDDGAMRAHLEEVVRLSRVTTELRCYDELKGMLAP